MHNMRVDIRFEPFNNEYHADVSRYNALMYLASDDLATLMDEVKKAVLELKQSR